MTRKEELRDNYEDALFALLMESVIEEEGKRLIEENERLKNDPAFEVPDEVKQRCTKTIRKAFARKNRRSSGKVAYRAFSNVAAVILLCGLLFTVAYAAVPEVRVSTLNLLIEVSDVSTKLTISGGGKSSEAINEIPPNSTSITLLGYRFPMPGDGFLYNTSRSKSGRKFAWAFFEHSNGASIEYSVRHSDMGESIDIDTENADRVLEIEINGAPGLLVDKENYTTLIWVDVNRFVFCSVTYTGLDSQYVMELASSVIFLPTETDK